MAGEKRGIWGFRRGLAGGLALMNCGGEMQGGCDIDVGNAKGFYPLTGLAFIPF
jgi:hypothetical protein